jgi:hypothetical protein
MKDVYLLKLCVADEITHGHHCMIGLILFYASFQLSVRVGVQHFWENKTFQGS